MQVQESSVGDFTSEAVFPLPDLPVIVLVEGQQVQFQPTADLCDCCDGIQLLFHDLEARCGMTDLRDFPFVQELIERDELDALFILAEASQWFGIDPCEIFNDETLTLGAFWAKFDDIVYCSKYGLDALI